MSKLQTRLARKDNFKDAAMSRNKSNFNFKKFLTSNPNWVHMKGQLDPEIKKKFIAHAKIEYKEHMTKMNNKKENK